MYILRLRETSEFIPRTKKGDAAQATTGIASANSIHPEISGLITLSMANPGTCSAMARTKIGRVSAKPIQKRRVMSMSSRFGPVCMLAISGSSAMPHLGQGPGPAWRTSGCIGQVWMESWASGFATGRGIKLSVNNPGLAVNFAQQLLEQK